MPKGVSTESAALVAKVGKAVGIDVEACINYARAALLNDYYSPLTYEEVAEIRRIYTEIE